MARNTILKDERTDESEDRRWPVTVARQKTLPTEADGYQQWSMLWTIKTIKFR